MQANSSFKNLQIIFFAMISGIALLFLVFLYLVQSKSTIKSTDENIIYTFVVILLSFQAVFFAPFIYRKRLATIKKDASLKEKISGYTQANIVKFAIIEAAIIFTLVVFYITANSFLAIIALILVTFFFLHKPSKLKFSEELNVNFREIESHL